MKTKDSGVSTNILQSGQRVTRRVSVKAICWGGGYCTVDEVRPNNSILGLNSIDFPVKLQQSSEDIPGPDVRGA